MSPCGLCNCVNRVQLIGCWVIVNISGQLLQGPHQADSRWREAAHADLHQQWETVQDLAARWPRQEGRLGPGEGEDELRGLSVGGVCWAWWAEWELLRNSFLWIFSDKTNCYELSHTGSKPGSHQSYAQCYRHLYNNLGQHFLIETSA